MRERTGGALPRGEFSTIKFGEPRGEEGSRRMALDEANVYDAPLSADAIRASFASGLAQLAARAPDEMPRATVVVKSLGFPVERRIAVYVSAAGAPSDPDGLSARLEVLPAAGGASRRRSRSRPHSTMRASCSPSSIPTGWRPATMSCA